MDEIVVSGIKASYAETIWPHCSFLVERALEHSAGEITLEQLYGKIFREEAQLWIVLRNASMVAVAVTELVQYDNIKALRIITLGGTVMIDWQEELDKVLTKFASREGASRLEAVGREGFTKRLEPLGYKRQYTIYHKEISHEQDSRNDNLYEHDRAPGLPATIH